MTLLKIAQLGHPILREQARPLTDAEISLQETQSFIDDMIDTMRDAQGAGLAANQVYRALQICVVEVDPARNRRYPYKPDIPLTVLINPVLSVLSPEENQFENFEGCLSVQNLRGRVLRHPRVRIVAKNREGEDLDFEMSGISAGTFQHELDHLGGILFIDRLSDTRSLCTGEHFDRFEKERFVAEVKAVVERYGQ